MYSYLDMLSVSNTKESKFLTYNLYFFRPTFRSCLTLPRFNILFSAVHVHVSLLFSPDSAQLLVSSPYCPGTPLDAVVLFSARTAGWCFFLSLPPLDFWLLCLHPPQVLGVHVYPVTKI